MNYTSTSSVPGTPSVPESRSSRFFLFAALAFLSVPLLVIATFLGWLSISTLLCTVAAGAFLLARRGPSYDLLHPVRVLGFLWCFCLALVSLHLSTVITDWDYVTWAYVVSGLLSFIGGFLLFRTDASAVTTREPSHIATRGATIELLQPTWTLAVAACCIVVGVGAFAYLFSQLGGITLLAANPNVERAKLFGIGGLGRDESLNLASIKIVYLFTSFCKFGLYLSCIALFQRTLKRRSHYFAAAAIICVGLFVPMAQAGRQFIYEPLVVSVILFHHLRRALRLRELAVVGVLLIATLSVVGYVRSVYSPSPELLRQADRWSKLPPGQGWDVVTHGYHTLTASFEVFHRMTQDLPALRRPSAGYLFYSVHSVFPRSNIQELAQELYTGEMITPTFLGEFYADFGAAGVILGPALLGFAYAYLYLRAARHDSLTWLLIFAVYLEMLTYFPYVNLFSQYVQWIWDALCIVCLVRIARRATTRISVGGDTGEGIPVF